MSQNPDQPVPPSSPESGGGAPTGELPKGLSIAAMVLGICSLAFCIPIINYLTLPIGIVGLVLSIMAMKKCNRGEAAGKGMAIAGLVCSLVGIALWVVIILIIGIIFAAAGTAAEGFGDALQKAAEEAEKAAKEAEDAQNKANEGPGSMGPLPMFQQNLELCVTYVRHYLG